MFWRSKNREAKPEPLPHESYAAANMARGLLLGVVVTAFVSLAAHAWGAFIGPAVARGEDAFTFGVAAALTLVAAASYLLVDRMLRKRADEYEAQMGLAIDDRGDLQ